MKTTANETNGIQNISIDMIQPNPHNTRKKINNDELVELSQSIKTIGLLQPITVRHKFETSSGVPVGDDHYQIVCGHRRFEAAKLAGLTEIPCIVRVLSDEEAFEIMVTENLQRKDIDPFDEAEAFDVLRKHGYDIDTLADKFGKSKSFVFSRLKLINLLPEFKEKYEKAEIEMSFCLIISRLDKDFQQRLLKSKFNGDYYDLSHSTVQQLKNAIAGMGCQLANAYFDTSACENCPKNTGCASLFLDMDKAVCEDNVCYENKNKEFALEAFEAVRKRNPDFFIISEKKEYLRDSDKLIYEELKNRGFNIKDDDANAYENIEQQGRFDISDQSITGYSFGWKGFFGAKREVQEYKPQPRIDLWNLTRLAENREEKTEQCAKEAAFEKILDMSDEELLNYKNGFAKILEAVLAALIDYTRNDDFKFGNLSGDMDADEAADAIEKMNGQGVLPAISKYLVASGLLDGTDTRFIKAVFPDAFKGSDEEGKSRFMEAARDCFLHYDTPVTDEMVEEEIAKILNKSK